MYCPNCDLRVETEFSRYFDQEGVDRHVRRYVDEDANYLTEKDTRFGTITLDKVGEVIERDDADDVQCGVRVDRCANCGEILEVWTFTRLV